MEISSDEENLPSGSSQQNRLSQTDMNVIMEAIKNFKLCFGSSIFDVIQRESAFFGGQLDGVGCWPKSSTSLQRLL